ncbi:MAG: acyl carrier protein [Betaproteobacteria bacterium]
MDKRLKVLLAEVFNVRESEIEPELKKEDVGSWDSLKQMDLVISLEKEYAIALEIPDILKMNSVSCIVEVLKSKGVTFGD